MLLVALSTPLNPDIIASPLGRTFTEYIPPFWFGLNLWSDMTLPFASTLIKDFRPPLKLEH